MADTGEKISGLPAATALDGTELLVAVQGGQTKKSTAAAVETLVKTGLTASDVGLGNVANERQYSANYPPPTPTPAEIGAVPTGRTVNGKALSADITLDAEDVGAIPTAEKGAAGGVAELDENGRIPTAQLPSYVDDVQEYASISAFPATGESGKIYVALDTNLTYRWSGTAYVEISPSLALGETSSTAYRGDRGKAAYDFSQAPYTSDPAMNGTASPGSASSWARGDHVHPTDTSRQAVLTWDDAPTVGSTNPVKSGGIYDAILKLYPADTVSGSPASFPDGADDVPVVDLKVSIQPVQEGSGDPSPTNVRPISGWKGLKLSNGPAMPDLTVYDVLDVDYDTPVDPNIRHTMTFGTKDCLENIQFDAPEALIFCPEGLSAGTRYYITADHAAYNAGTTQDGDFGFTPTQDVPAGGYVRHSVLGVYRSDSTYTKAQVLAGKFITYGTDFAQIEQLTTDEGSEGTYLGKTTAADPTYLDSNYPNVNYTQRNGHGSNDWETSNIRQRLNSAGTGWWVQKTKFDFPPADVSTLQGFLTGIDPALRENMQTVKKRYATSVADRLGGAPLYKDVEDKVFLLSMTEVNLGANNSQYETSFGLDDTLKTTPYAYYVGTVNADRIKLLNGAPRYWWLRGPLPTLALTVRIVNTDGSLNNSAANYSIGLVAAFAVRVESLYSFSWQAEAGTVYGGTLDVTTGVLTVTRGQIASYAGETLPGAWISDRDVYAAGTSPSTGAQVVYELAEPITYQLTPTQVRTLYGENNLWADTGDVTAEYRADLEKYIEKKTGEVQALILDNI